jgi:hypothetical protein
MTSVEVKAETKAIKCEWTREMATDISQFAGFDDYFDRVLAKEFRRELRKKSINKIFQK